MEKEADKGELYEPSEADESEANESEADESEVAPASAAQTQELPDHAEDAPPSRPPLAAQQTDELSIVAAPTAPCAIAAPHSLRIDTLGMVPITSKEDYLQSELSVESATGTSELAIRAQIRGRGNTTWYSMPKKPFRLKLDGKATLLGMPADKDWVLLANYADKTMLRNAVAFCLGTLLDMTYVPRYAFAELTLNGEYQGLYQVVEHIKASPARVPLGDGPAESAFLLEIDARLDGSLWFVSNAKVPYVIKSEATSDQGQAIASYIDRFESALFGAEFTDPEAGYARYLDVDSMVDFYLVNELIKNTDAFWSSTFVYKSSEGRLTFGPLWDFDITSGNVNYNDSDKAEGLGVASTTYMKRLLEDPRFEAKVRERWRYLSTRLPALWSFIDESALTLDGAQTRNFAQWKILDQYVWPNPVATGSYVGEIAYLKSWLRARASWLDNGLASPGLDSFVHQSEVLEP